MAKRPVEESWPASKIEMWPIEKIRQYGKNPRTHPPAQIDLLASSMKDDGVTAPILVDEAGVIIAGHGRRLAALQNGYKRFPVVVARGWSEVKKRAVRIKDNSYALLSGWDKELVGGEIKLLSAAGYEMKLLGFGDAQLVQFTTVPGPPQQFQAFGEDIEVTHQCPKCGYKASGDWTVKKAEPEKKNGKRGAKK